VADGRWSAVDNPLVNSPHTAADIVVDNWEHGYSREQAVYPVPALRLNKFWSPVNRIDNVYGDRNLVCSCPPPEAWSEE
jgi:glycine dehydrogenase